MKKIFGLLLGIFSIALFSCSQSKDSELVIPVGEIIAAVEKAGSASRGLDKDLLKDETFYSFNLQVSGDYSTKKSVSGTLKQLSDETIEVTGLSPDMSLQINIVISESEVEMYEGSEKIVLEEGDNVLTVTLHAIKAESPSVEVTDGNVANPEIVCKKKSEGVYVFSVSNADLYSSDAEFMWIINNGTEVSGTVEARTLELDLTKSEYIRGGKNTVAISIKQGSNYFSDVYIFNTEDME